jgi:hypothetical protein
MYKYLVDIKNLMLNSSKSKWVSCIKTILFYFFIFTFFICFFIFFLLFFIFFFIFIILYFIFYYLQVEHMI